MTRYSLPFLLVSAVIVIPNACSDQSSTPGEDGADIAAFPTADTEGAPDAATPSDSGGLHGDSAVTQVGCTSVSSTLCAIDFMGSAMWTRGALTVLFFSAPLLDPRGVGRSGAGRV